MIILDIDVIMDCFLSMIDFCFPFHLAALTIPAMLALTIQAMLASMASIQGFTLQFFCMYKVLIHYMFSVCSVIRLLLMVTQKPPRSLPSSLGDT